MKQHWLVKCGDAERIHRSFRSQSGKFAFVGSTIISTLTCSAAASRDNSSTCSPWAFHPPLYSRSADCRQPALVVSYLEFWLFLYTGSVIPSGPKSPRTSRSHPMLSSTQPDIRLQTSLFIICTELSHVEKP